MNAALTCTCEFTDRVDGTCPMHPQCAGFGCTRIGTNVMTHRDSDFRPHVCDTHVPSYLAFNWYRVTKEATIV